MIGLKSITKNFTSLILAHVAYKILSFFCYILIARRLGVAVFGQLSFAISYVGLFAVCMDFGLNELLIRDVAGRIDELGPKYMANILGLKLIFAIASFLLLATASAIISVSPQIRLITLILTLALISDSFIIFFRCVFRLFEKMEFEAVSLILEGLLKFGLIAVALQCYSVSPLTVSYMLLSASVVTAVITIPICYLRFSKVRPSLDLGLTKTLIAKAMPFAFLAFFGVLNFRVSTVIVSRMLGDIATGWYAAAVRLIEPMLVVYVVAAIVLFPVGSRLAKSSKEKLLVLYRASLKWLLLGGLFLAVAVGLASRNAVFMVFGAEYRNSVLPLRILSLSLIPFSIKFFLERMALILHKPKAIFFSYGLGTFIIVLFGIRMVDFMGYAGAGLALLLSESSIVICNFAVVSRHMNKAISCTR